MLCWLGTAQHMCCAARRGIPQHKKAQHVTRRHACLSTAAQYLVLHSVLRAYGQQLAQQPVTHALPQERLQVVFHSVPLSVCALLPYRALQQVQCLPAKRHTDLLPLVWNTWEPLPKMHLR